MSNNPGGARLAIGSIDVPAPLNRQFDAQPSYVPYTYDGSQTKIQQPTFHATLRVGSKYEHWVVDVMPLR